jgi:hypothetical protein
VDEGVPGWYSPLGMQGGASPRFTERRCFKGKRGEDHPPISMSVSGLMGGGPPRIWGRPRTSDY